MGDGEGGGEGRFVKSEMVASRMSEGEITLSVKSAVLIATFVAANMVVVSCVVTVMPSKSQRKMEKERKGRKGRSKEEKGFDGRTTAWQGRREWSKEWSLYTVTAAVSEDSNYSIIL
jgi:hypothetical protein